MIWLLLALLAIAGLTVLFAGSRPVTGGTVDPVAHYRAQLDEIDADEARGAIDTDSAKAARIELQRRLLRAGQQDVVIAPHSSPLGPKKVGVAAAIFLAFAAGLYALMGSPGTPAVTSSPRQEAANQQVDNTGMTLGQALEQVRTHLEDNPRDMEGWRVLASTARSVADYVTAAQAYGELAQMNPDEPNWRANELEAYIAHAGGQLTPAARLVLAALIDKAPDHPAGQYYLGLAQVQSGNEAAARATWTALADRSSADAPWMPQLRQQLSALGVAPPALSDRDIAVVDAMSEEEREAFMASMLARLEDRLDSDPSDTRGWLMLARSKLALGDREAAITALESGIAANPGEKSVELQAFLDNLQENPDL